MNPALALSPTRRASRIAPSPNPKPEQARIVEEWRLLSGDLRKAELHLDDSEGNKCPTFLFINLFHVFVSIQSLSFRNVAFHFTV